MTRSRYVALMRKVRPLIYHIESARLASRKCDIVLRSAVGLSLPSWWPVLRRRALVMNTDGCNWRRAKWSWLDLKLIHAMYRPACAAASRIVNFSEVLCEDFGSAIVSKIRFIACWDPGPRSEALRDSTREQFGIARPFALVINGRPDDFHVHFPTEQLSAALVMHFSLKNVSTALAEMDVPLYLTKHEGWIETSA